MNKTLKGIIIGFIIGAVLMLPTTMFADSLAQYILSRAKYPIIVDGTPYDSDLPILNYEGYTYVPLRHLSDLLNVNIYWNESLRQVEITHGDTMDNPAFRNISVSGSFGSYVVTGEARVFEATVQYDVEDGHFVYLEGFVTASQGAPGWGTFTINISIPEADLPGNATLMLILYEESAEDGSRLHEMPVVLEVFP